MNKSNIRKKGVVLNGLSKAEPNTVRKAWEQSGNPQCRRNLADHTASSHKKPRARTERKRLQTLNTPPTSVMHCLLQEACSS